MLTYPQSHYGLLCKHIKAQGTPGTHRRPVTENLPSLARSRQEIQAFHPVQVHLGPVSVRHAEHLTSKVPYTASHRYACKRRRQLITFSKILSVFATSKAPNCIHEVASTMSVSAGPSTNPPPQKKYYNTYLKAWGGSLCLLLQSIDGY